MVGSDDKVFKENLAMILPVPLGHSPSFPVGRRPSYVSQRAGSWVRRAEARSSHLAGISLRLLRKRGRDLRAPVPVHARETAWREVCVVLGVSRASGATSAASSTEWILDSPSRPATAFSPRLWGHGTQDPRARDSYNDSNCFYLATDSENVLSCYWHDLPHRYSKREEFWHARGNYSCSSLIYIENKLCILAMEI